MTLDTRKTDVHGKPQKGNMRLSFNTSGEAVTVDEDGTVGALGGPSLPTLAYIAEVGIEGGVFTWNEIYNNTGATITWSRFEQLLPDDFLEYTASGFPADQKFIFNSQPAIGYDATGVPSNKAFTLVKAADSQYPFVSDVYMEPWEFNGNKHSDVGLVAGHKCMMVVYIYRVE